jgi:hypothetical protein
MLPANFAGGTGVKISRKFTRPAMPDPATAT